MALYATPTALRAIAASSWRSARVAAPAARAGAQVEEQLAPSVVTRDVARDLRPAGAGAITRPSPSCGAWLDEMSQRLATRIPDARAREDFLATVHYEATRAGLDPQLVLGVIQHESAFRKYAVSIAGARGYMQVMPFWTKLIGVAAAQPVPSAHQPALRLRDPAPLPRHRERRRLPRARPLQRQPRPARVPERRDGRDGTATGRTRRPPQGRTLGAVVVPTVARASAARAVTRGERDRHPLAASAPYRGRFAPSPTGPLHFGSLIAALASYCDARRAAGSGSCASRTSIAPRTRPGAERAILAHARALWLRVGRPGGAPERAHRALRGGARAADRGRRRLPVRLHAARAANRRPLGAAGERVYPGTCRHGIPRRSRARAAQRAWRVRVDRERRQRVDRIPRSAARPRSAGSSRATSATSSSSGPTVCSRTSSPWWSTMRRRASPTSCAAPICRVHAAPDLPAAAARLPDAVVPARSRCRRRERHEAVEADARRARCRGPAAGAGRRVAVPRSAACRTARRRRPSIGRILGVRARARGHPRACPPVRDAPGAGSVPAAIAPGRYNSTVSAGVRRASSARIATPVRDFMP